MPESAVLGKPSTASAIPRVPPIKESVRAMQSRIVPPYSVEEPAAQDVLVDVRSFLTERRVQTDQWFFLVRMVLAIGAVGYLVVSPLSTSSGTPTDLVLVGTYLLANVSVFLVADRSFGYTRWFYAALDFVFLLLLRHLFLFEALVDPNATMVGFFSLLLVAYVSYSDPRLLGSLAVGALAATGVTLWLDVANVLGSALAYRSHPLRAVLLFAYLSVVGVVTYMLARRLRSQVTAYSSELLKRAQSAMGTAVERARRERLEELNQLKHDFIAVLSHELRTPITPLRTSLEMVRSELVGTESSAREMVEIAIEASIRLQRLVQDYTRLAELLTMDTPNSERYNLSLIEVLGTLLPEHTRGRFFFHHLEDLSVAGEPRLLGGAILALTRRAQLVTPGGEMITFRGYAENHDVVFSIHDPASYVEAKAILDLEDPFAYSSERTYFAANTGLELILAQHSIRRMGGHIWIESAPDEGTTVFVSVPGAREDVRWMSVDELRQELSAFML